MQCSESAAVQIALFDGNVVRIVEADHATRTVLSFCAARHKMLHVDVFDVNVGTYNPLLGKGYGEIAAESRSQHKSQGFGVAAVRGQRIEYLEELKSNLSNDNNVTLKHPLENINTTWNNVANSEKIVKSLQKANQKFEIENPQKSVPLLLEL